MGTSRSWAELQAKLDRALRNVEASTPATVRAAAEAAQEKFDGEIKARVPDMDMSGLSSQKTKSGKQKSGKVGTKIVRAKGAAPGSALSVRATGAVHWLEAGTRPHLVGAGRVNAARTTRGRYRKANAKFLMAAGAAHPVRGPLAHPGTAAGHTWSKGMRQAIPAAGETFKRRAVRDVAEPFL